MTWIYEVKERKQIGQHVLSLQMAQWPVKNERKTWPYADRWRVVVANAEFGGKYNVVGLTQFNERAASEIFDLAAATLRAIEANQTEAQAND